MAKVSVVIPTLNGGALFEEVLEKIRAQRFAGEVELVVIDSGSTDQTVAAAKKAGARVMEILPGEFDHGLTRNRGIEESGGEIVVLMTQDAVPADEGLIAQLVAGFEDPRVGGVFGRQIPRAEHDVLVSRNIRTWIAGSATGRVSEIVDRAAYEGLPAMEKFLMCVFDNVCSAVRRSAWVDLPFRQNAFGEDIEWSKRALEAGWKIAYVPEAAVIHSHARSAMYEYKRTYMCHRTLFRIFGVQTIPGMKYVPGCVWRSMTTDMAYVVRHEKQWGKRWSLLARVPGLSLASVWGQYRGARDEQRGHVKRMRGV